MDKERVTCKNCNNSFTGRYCNICGQKASVHKITWSHMAHDATHAMFHLDKGIIHSAKELGIRPGYTIKEYLDGKRVNHFNPLLMLILVGGFCSYLYGLTDMRTLLAPIRIHDIEAESPFMAHKYFAITMSVSCILFTLGDFLIALNRKYSFPELLIGNAFLCGEVLLFQIVMIPVFLLGRQIGINEYIRYTCIVLIVIYIFYAKYQFFEAANSRNILVRVVLVTLLLLVSVYFIANKIFQPMFAGG